ncbi:hypothetical protein BGX38DRAFT_613271 [Terfezia claveryi]|nr:hypothetical protein BGX38DRAFT_613271 [Terfezia claveryi]
MAAVVCHSFIDLPPYNSVIHAQAPFANLNMPQLPAQVPTVAQPKPIPRSHIHQTSEKQSTVANLACEFIGRQIGLPTAHRFYPFQICTCACVSTCALKIPTVVIKSYCLAKTKSACRALNTSERPTQRAKWCCKLCRAGYQARVIHHIAIGK